MILKGDCIEVMKAMKPNSIDAIVCDPPYGLRFMNKDWDTFTPSFVKEEQVKATEEFQKSIVRRNANPNLKGRKNSSIHSPAAIAGSYDFSPKGNRAYQEQMRLWLTEAYRVLKPGGSMLVMGGTRTSHRLACAIEDTGFIIKDTLAFMYGSGFPKAQTISTGLTDRFLQASLQGAFHWKNKILNSQDDYQENCRLCGEQLQSSLMVFLNTDLIKAYVPEHNHLSLREFSIHQGNGHKYKVSSFDVFSPHAMQDFSPLLFALPKDAFAQASKLNGIVPILIDGNLPSSKLLLDALHEWHNDIYLSNSESFPGESMPVALKIIYHNGHILIESYCNHDGKNASFFEQLKNKVSQKYSHKYRILPLQKDQPFYCISDGMSPVAYIHFSKSCKDCQVKIYQALIDYEGYKCGGLKPAWEPIIFAYKPVEKSIVDNVLKWGVGAVNVDECRIEAEDNIPLFSKDNQRPGTSFDVGSKRTGEFSTKGRFPANVILSHHPECVQVGMKKVKSESGSQINQSLKGSSIFGNDGKVTSVYKDPDGYETVESWDCHPDCAVRLLDEQSGVLKSGDGNRGIHGSGDMFPIKPMTRNFNGDSGGASRFFYCAKASRGERNAGLEGMEEREATTYHDESIEGAKGRGRNPRHNNPVKNNHPTVKPIKLFEWLIKLVTREGQIVLDPFIGSGTTAIAAHNTGRKCVGIEKEGEYLEIAKRRIEYWENQPKQMEMRI